MKRIRVGIVGANGFIGRHLTVHLQSTGNVDLVLFGRSTQSSFGSSFPYFRLNLQNIESSSAALSGLDLVFYLASETIPATSWQNPMLEIENNLKPFLNFCELVAKQGTKKVVFVSSAGTVYGGSELRLTEDAATRPFSPYGIVKLAMENFLNYFQKKHALGFDIYRVSNVYGDGQDVSKGLGIINTFIERIINDGKIVIFGDGQSTRNYIYVKDVAAMLSLSVLKPLDDSSIYNLASDDTLSINALLEIIKKTVTENFKVEYHPTRQSDNTAIDLDNTKILAALPSFKLTPINQGISQTYSFIKNKIV